MALRYILTKRTDETFSAAWSGGPEELTAANPVIVLKMSAPIYNVDKVTTVTDESEGATTVNGVPAVYFKKYFRYKNNGAWSELIDLSQLSGTTFGPCIALDLEIYYYRVADGDYPNTTLYIDNVLVNGTYKFAETDSEATLNDKDAQIILAPSDIYKIFRLDNFQVISNHKDYEILYRFTQDNNNTYTNWEELTTANISTIRLNPLRFAKAQYLITNKSSIPLRVYDVVLEGDFQNVSANYLKTNRYGLKEDCLTALQNMEGAPGSDKLHQNFYTACLGSYNQDTDVTQAITNDNTANKGQLWNPYQFDKITQLANMLGNQVSDIVGWNVEYHLTDPDKNGEDMYVHEYGLKNIVDMKTLKVVVPDNKFPIDRLIMNQFNLDLFETFTIHIMKDEFRRAFGITRRPAQDDIVYMCEANMMFMVRHCQQFKSIMNSATYWVVVLEKYEYKADVRHQLAESRDAIKTLTNNTTLNELFGEDNTEQEKKIANKEQTIPTSFDKVRQRISKYIGYGQKSLYIDNFEFITSWYDLSDSHIRNKVAINYNAIDQNLLDGDNRSIMFWAKFKNKYEENGRITKAVLDSYNINNDKYTFLSNYDSTNKLGYEVSCQGDIFQFKLNGTQYTLGTELLTNVWYAFVVELNQRQKELNLSIYRRDSAITITLINMSSYEKVLVDSTDLTGLTYYVSQGYKGLNNEETTVFEYSETYLPSAKGISVISERTMTIEPVSFSHGQMLSVPGSESLFTNLRIFNKEIYDDINSLLKQNIITEAQYLILADNANKQIVTTNLWNKNWK